MRAGFAVLAFVLIATPPASAQKADASLLRTTLGVVEMGGGDETRVWFDLVRSDQRFAYDPRKVTSPDPVMKSLTDSQSTAKSVHIHFFVDGATFDVGDSKPTYLVHDITYEDHTVEVASQVPPPDPNAVPLARAD